MSNPYYPTNGTKLDYMAAFTVPTKSGRKVLSEPVHKKGVVLLILHVKTEKIFCETKLVLRIDPHGKKGF